MKYALSQHAFRASARGLGLAVATLMLAACGQEGGNQSPPPSPVTTATVETERAAHRVEYPGRLHGATEVAVRARVSGILESREYEEGTAVEAGQTLFQIEPGPYEDQVKSAEAELASAQAQTLRTEREWERVSGLFERDAVSERERDQARADHRAAVARLEAAESALSNARRELRYTRVEAPVSGITSMEAITEGNLVDMGTVLTHVVQHDPVQVYFSLPEEDATAQRLARKAQKDDDADSEREATLIRRDGSEYEQGGIVDFADRRIDPMTGSVQMRATFPNPDGELIPGQFVRVRLTLKTYENAILVQPTAVGEGAEGPQVFTVSSDNTAQARKVTLGPMIGDQQLILDGLNEGDQLVINGQVALRDEAPVQVTNGENQGG